MTEAAAAPSSTSVRYLGYGPDEKGHLHLVMDISGKRVVLPTEIIGKDAFFSIINSHGAGLYKRASRENALQLIEGINCNDLKFEIATQMGWRGTVFVLGTQVIGRPDREVIPSLEHVKNDILTKYRRNGTLGDWKKRVLSLCDGNSRLILAICWAFASAVAPLIPGAQRTGGFQLIGLAEQGKTTVLIVAGSVWGCSMINETLGFAESWNTTPNELEMTMVAHRHIGLIIDEAGASTADHANQLLRMSGGATKRRMTQPSLSFEEFILSSSNVATTELVAGRGPHEIGAVLSRMMDIPLPEGDSGVFDQLHGRQHGGDLANDLKVACLENFGTAGPAFVKKLVEWMATENGADECRALLKKWRDYYLKLFRRRAKGMRYDERSADRCATIYAAGRLTRRLRITPWATEKVREAILACHLDAVRSAHPLLLDRILRPTQQGGLAALRYYFAKYRSEFVDLNTTPLQRDADKLGAARGYLASFKGNKWVYFEACRFKQIVGGAAACKVVCDQLEADGHLNRTLKSITTQRPVYREGGGNKRYARVVAIRLRAFKSAQA